MKPNAREKSSPYIGEMVHLRVTIGGGKPQCLAAVLTEIGTLRNDFKLDPTSADLYVFKSSMPYFMYAVPLDDSKSPGDITWHPAHEPVTGEL